MGRTLYMTVRSPGSRSVLMTLSALNLDVKQYEVDLINGENLKPEYLAINPQHTVPTLDDNGTIIWDSHAIMTYLINKYAKGHPLYPEDPVQRAKVDQRLHFDTGVTFPILITTVKPIKLKLTKDVPKEKVDAAKEAYGFLDKFLEGQDYVAGNSVTLADLSLIATVTTLDFFFPVANYKNIVNWIKRCEKLPYYSANQVGLDNFKTYFGELLKN